MTTNLTATELIQVAAEAADPATLAVLASMPPILLETSLFPYQAGATFVAGLRADGGYASLNAAFAKPPASTAQILHPEKYASGEGPVPVALPDDLAALFGAGWTEFATDTLGELQTRVWLKQGGVAGDAARTAADGWGGDRMILVRGPDGTSSVLVYASTWDTPGGRRCVPRRGDHGSRRTQTGRSDRPGWASGRDRPSVGGCPDGDRVRGDPRSARRLAHPLVIRRPRVRTIVLVLRCPSAPDPALAACGVRCGCVAFGDLQFTWGYYFRSPKRTSVGDALMTGRVHRDRIESTRWRRYGAGYFDRGSPISAIRPASESEGSTPFAPRPRKGETWTLGDSHSRISGGHGGA